MSKKSCAARCSRGSVQGVLRAPAEGEGGVAHREDLAATASATLERSTGTVAHGKRAARERRRRRSKVSRRRRAGHAPPARRGRRVRVPRAFKRPAKTLWWWWWWWRTPTPNYLRQASPDRGKYLSILPQILGSLPEVIRSCCHHHHHHHHHHHTRSSRGRFEWSARFHALNRPSRRVAGPGKRHSARGTPRAQPRDVRSAGRDTWNLTGEALGGPRKRSWRRCSRARSGRRSAIRGAHSGAFDRP